PIGLGDSKSIKWVSWYESTGKERPIVLKTIRYNNEECSLELDIGWPAYFMDYSNSRRDYREPDIYFLLGGYGSIGSDTEAALIEKTGFKIISWECDPPIENEYR
ncbi:MAG: hypothetical protein IJO95_02505, partial [Clostridia bacterium]|nr:hypothetical protein [Clostridia bacterium]